MSLQPDADPDAPSATPQPLPGARDDDGAAAAAGGSDDGASDPEDDVPDYSQLLALTARARGSAGTAAAAAPSGSASAPFIPKRGEKDFEPTGFGGQLRALEKSRAAMREAISGERRIGSKTLSSGTWVPELQRCVLHVQHGAVFSSLGYTRRVPLLEDGSDADLWPAAEASSRPAMAGVTKDGIFYPRMRSRFELLPEEALYLVERGGLECRRRVQAYRGTVHDTDEAWVGMSVQQAWAELSTSDGLTRERYQVYAYLKRLGYPVQRAATYEELHRAASAARQSESGAAKGIVADPRRPLRLVTVFDLLLYPFRRAAQLLGDADHSMRMWFRRLLARLAPPPPRGTGLLGIGGRRWDTYDSVFSKLRIVPSGHAQRPRQALPSTERFPIFYYAWRPATRFKKTDPSPPEFRIAVAPARSTSVPSAAEFAHLFGQVPVPLALGEAGDDEAQRAREEKLRNDESYGRMAVRKLERERRDAQQNELQRQRREASVMLRMLARLPAPLQVQLEALDTLLRRLAVLVAESFAHAPPGALIRFVPRRGPRTGADRRPPNPFPALKAGRRTVVLAICDNGTMTMLRFGEAEFDKWQLAGEGGPGRG